jgi:hypothetical protein
MKDLVIDMWNEHVSFQNEEPTPQESSPAIYGQSRNYHIYLPKCALKTTSTKQKRRAEVYKFVDFCHSLGEKTCGGAKECKLTGEQAHILMSLVGTVEGNMLLLHVTLRYLIHPIIQVKGNIHVVHL